MTNPFWCDIISKSLGRWLLVRLHGGIAQLARALGSYPGCHWFESDCRYQNGPLVKRLRHRPFTAESWVRFPYGSPSTFAHIWLNKADCELFILLWKSRCPLLVRYCENFIAECIFYAPCFSFFRKPKAPSIASATLACAVWNWWQYTFKVVDEQQCPNAPETVVTSSPAEIKELAAKWRKLCRP